ncbi:isochorismatase family protein [Hydrogenophaga sp. PBL-H3]|uniref:isochorismatase family protein n=1 Tax=Hydrogenophaga sp. PBL-H3 TaxID=434010 RepID=UPI001F4530BA|nr:isochorismatase family protein [Hydrogenophaga sp. PBL-H3]
MRYVKPNPTKTALLIIDVQQGLCEGEGLAFESDAVIVRKTTPDAFQGTDLDALLNAHGVTRLIVCGMRSEFCVDTTTRRALALGYPVTLVADAHTSAGNAVLTSRQVIDHHNATLTNVSSFGPRVLAMASADVQRGA